MKFLKEIVQGIDWWLLGPALLISAFGLITMKSFSGALDVYFNRQLIWLVISVLFFIIVSRFDITSIRRTNSIFLLYGIVALTLGGVLIFGDTLKGARSWFDLGLFSFQPVELAKLTLILLLAKFFAKRHVEIARIRHLIVSGLYVGLYVGLTLLQPDFGSAMVLVSIWFGLVLVSGISKKHLAILFCTGILVFSGAWVGVFKEYQKQRILTFINPTRDIRGSGYNAYQSMIAVGSGQLFGKGVGYGTQSRLRFLPEYQTDFIFAAYAEEWGFIGVLTLLASFALLLLRAVQTASQASSNFESFLCIGIWATFFVHIMVNIGMNIGLLPVTGITVPFLSYGGTSLLVSYFSLAIISGISFRARKNRRIPREVPLDAVYSR